MPLSPAFVWRSLPTISFLQTTFQKYLLLDIDIRPSVQDPGYCPPGTAAWPISQIPECFSSDIQRFPPNYGATVSLWKSSHIKKHKNPACCQGCHAGKKSRPPPAAARLAGQRSFHVVNSAVVILLPYYFSSLFSALLLSPFSLVQNKDDIVLERSRHTSRYRFRHKKYLFEGDGNEQLRLSKRCFFRYNRFEFHPLNGYFSVSIASAPSTAWRP